VSVYPLLTCAIARSTKVLGDRWSLLILRDIILHKKSRFKEFRSSKEKIATNILSNRLKSLMDAGLIEKLDPLGSKKSTRYIATKRGIQALPIIIEMYLFSIHTISEAILNESQLNIKRQVLEDRVLFQENATKEYGAFIKALITQKDA
jgi:DNA-binding HxlR family transcriptional regulator